MSLVAKVEQLYAEAGDGLLNALKHVAGEVEKIGGGGVDVAKLEAEIKTAFEAKTSEMLASLHDQVAKEMAAIAGGVGDLQVRIAALEHQVPQLPQEPPVNTGSGQSQEHQPADPAQVQPQSGTPPAQTTGTAQGGNPT